MNNLKANENWSEQKSRIKEQLARLSNTKMMYEEDRKEEILEKLALAVGKSKAEIARILDGL